MKTLKSLSANLKSVTLVALLIALILGTGLIATKTLLFNGKSRECCGVPTLNANAGGPGLQVTTGDASVRPSEPTMGSGEPSVSAGNLSVTVWVNTKSGVYHCSNSRWYGNTKNGKYVTQKEAHAEGYRPAYGIVCTQ